MGQPTDKSAGQPGLGSSSQADGATASAPTEARGGAPGSGLPAELTLRVASALALACAALVLGYWGGWLFIALIAAVVVAMSWEWANIVRRGGFDLAFSLHLSGVLAAILAAALGHVALALVALAIATVLVAIQQFRRQPALSALGVFYVGLPAVALVGLRLDPGHGFAALMFVLTMVWTSDTFALVAGKSIGGPKLWPALSPRKTWAGLLGGTLASGLMGGLFALLLVTGSSVVLLAVTGLTLGLVAQLGDLAESALKRYCGVKDASDLIPGHGGFLDRLDGVVTAAPLAALIGLLRNAEAPARALLLGN